ncbi:Predicted RNA-binding protein, contains TRAM domain [Natronoarchaeum philippinense]|uniref:Predicted RNA-binding protein, contains TRAM domain n=1 Tax=Natronoarchaeum philippinense TaxID=558529 RepID=A0A285PBE1_NATPI|nr:Predicted RNA-binding protein, contains TRAM domain [Natronoarchaeum philippinense]
MNLPVEMNYLLGAGLVVVALLVAALAWRVRSLRSTAAASKRAHEAAQEREPPVDKGEVIEVGVEELTEHHSGRTDALVKVEGFVVFVTDVPDDVEPADMLRAKVLSFNRDGTSASAKLLERL